TPTIRGPAFRSRVPRVRRRPSAVAWTCNSARRALRPARFQVSQHPSNPRRQLMTGHRIAFLASALLALGVARTWAAEGVEAHTTHAPKTIILDNERVQPADLQMAPSDAVVFENHSVHPITVTFIEPADLADKIRCGLVRKS